MLPAFGMGARAPVPPGKPQRGAEVAAEARRVAQRACLHLRAQPDRSAASACDVGRLRHRERPHTPAMSGATQSARPALLRWLIEWREAKISPGIVTVGTPIHSASQVVSPPE